MDILLIIKKLHTKKVLYQFHAPEAPTNGTIIRLYDEDLDKEFNYKVDRSIWHVTKCGNYSDLKSVDVFVSIKIGV